MAPFLRQLASFFFRRFCRRTGPAFKAVWLAGLGLAMLSSCSRAAYVFSPGPRAYLDTERAAPSVPAAPQATAGTDSLPAAAGPRPPAPARQPARRLRPAAAGHAVGGVPTWPRALATKFVAKRFAKLATASRKARPAARYERGAGSSATLVVALCLLGAGLLGLLVGASISTNLVGAIFGVFLLVLGSLALVVGFILLLVALVAKE